MVGIPHAKWGERPLLVVVPQPQYAPGEILGCSTMPAGDKAWDVSAAQLLLHCNGVRAQHKACWG